MHYPVVIHKDKESDFGVIVPDLAGCFSAGDTYEEALTNAVEAIECHLEGLLRDNQTIPVAKEIDNYIHKREYAGGIWALVEINISQLSGKAKRINITLPERLLRLIDLHAKNLAHKNRSAFIADATLAYMSQDNYQHNTRER
ncbi:MAG: type II toxin-antitoxin system HicB family antitoxin [Pseudomonadota bacterium]